MLYFCAFFIVQTSVFEDVVIWCEEITVLMEKEISGGSIDLKALIRRVRGKKYNMLIFLIVVSLWKLLLCVFVLIMAIQSLPR